MTPKARHIHFSAERALELYEHSAMSKHESLVRAILVCIDEAQFRRGDALPSVSAMASETGFAKQTIVKAYGDLKKRGLVDARPRKGFYIASESTAQVTRVALLLYAFQAFQEGFYTTFRGCLGDNIQVDTFFHHNNFDVLSDTVTKIAGNYGMYVIAGIDHPEMCEVLNILPAANLLMIDRPPPATKQYPFVAQEFEQTTYDNLSLLTERIKGFQEVVLFFRAESDIPIGILKGFKRYTRDAKVKHVVQAAYAPGSLKRNRLYITTADSDLWRLLEDCITQNLKVGDDVGVLSHNDSTIKKILSGGITTLSTDFNLMAQYAADYVLTRQPLAKYLPTKLISRNSL